MKITEIDSSLYCSHCHDETLHRVQYLNGKVLSIECTYCHRKMVTNMSPTRELSKEIYKRVLSKPTDLTKEYKEDHNKFIDGMPKRVISKPFRLIRYVNETKKAFKKFKDL
ncbi:bh protein [Bacillus sp. ISL-40]|uniref:bh protein n=1 Tax=unclassified Bacillus (in: firmicutes) TaxID=185979 RepID=UPI001BE803C7|nr:MULTISPECIES: bh protein [unclassified Bacillus (in: firmicutes)]MBT2696614.1 bh protein [Bacillus sp. ISL-40]MBT2740824.1 bh protein [Bacillus sp. ISL-77]